LLSNGSEDTKGNAAIRGAAELLAADDRINYCGFVEGDDLHRGLVDVIVCDGLVGNVALKVAEGTAELARNIVSETLGRHWWGRLIRSRAEEMQRSLDADRHGGALLLGLQGVVVKSHGSSSEAAFGAALDLAASCVEHGLTSRMADYLKVQEV
jgi:glycerol-3-phosphate acyltransferase PlsX